MGGIAEKIRDKLWNHQNHANIQKGTKWIADIDNRHPSNNWSRRDMT